jgi:hypothetical protein
VNALHLALDRALDRRTAQAGQFEERIDAGEFSVRADALREALACDAPRCACRRSGSRATHCPAHPDRVPSLAVDDRGGVLLVHCHAGCSQRSIITALQRRGLWPAGRGPASRAPARRRSLLDEARAAVLRDVRRQEARLAPYRERDADAGSIRACNQVVALARREATQLGGESEVAWDLLAAAAALELLTFAAEARLDEELAA